MSNSRSIKIQGLIVIGTSMDSESPRSRDLGCWDCPTATAGFVQLAADLTPKDDFEPGQDYYDYLMDIGHGKDADAPTRAFWAEIIKKRIKEMRVRRKFAWLRSTFFREMGYTQDCHTLNARYFGCM